MDSTCFEAAAGSLPPTRIAPAIAAAGIAVGLLIVGARPADAVLLPAPIRLAAIHGVTGWAECPAHLGQRLHPAVQAEYRIVPATESWEQ